MSEWSQSDSNQTNVRLIFNQHWRPGVTVSSLIIQRVNKSHNGVFQCIPSNSEAKQIKVHVLKGEFTMPSKNMNLPYSIRVCTERIFDIRPFMYNKIYLKKNLIEVGSSHLYASFGTFCVEICLLFEAQ